MTPDARRPSRGARERGLTLTELTIIGILATIVMLALTGFYFSSQQLWMDGSTQAMAQRDATILVDAIRARAHEADDALVEVGKPDADHDALTLAFANHDTTVTFQYDPADTRMHLYYNGVDDMGPVIFSPVKRFHVSYTSPLIDMPDLDIRSANGDSVQMSTTFALLGKGP